MSSPGERRARADAALARAHELEAATRSLGVRGRRRARGRAGAATALLADVDDVLDELRGRGYVELDDGRWLNPKGEIVEGTERL